MKTKEEILITNCPVFSALFHDRSNKASVMMKESILKSMTEFADQEKQALKDEWYGKLLKKLELIRDGKMSLTEYIGEVKYKTQKL